MDQSARRADRAEAGQAAQKPAALAWIFRLAELAVMALIVFVLVRAVLTFIAPSSVWPQPEINPAPVQSARAQTGASVRFTAFDAFHRAPSDAQLAEQGAQPIFGADAPETTLRLKLTGRRAGPGGSAILELLDRSQSSFVVGDEIIDGVTLRAVTAQYIVIEQSGRLERLTFDKESVMMESAVPETQASPAVDFVPLASRGQASFQTLMMENSLRPALRGGTKIGLEIVPNAPGDTLAGLGLEAGDILLQIGSINVAEGLGDINALMRETEGRKTIAVNVLRGDTELTVDIAL